jgi:hypothetical protein
MNADRLINDTTYRRIGSGRTPLGTSSYWLASDHLLVVDEGILDERYRRIDFRQVEGIIIAASNIPRYLALVCLVAALTQVALYFGNRPVAIPLGISFLSAAIILFAYGKAARLKIKTTVHLHGIAGVRRWGAALKLFETLAPAVASFRANLPMTPSGTTNGSGSGEFREASSLPNPPH